MRGWRACPRASYDRRRGWSHAARDRPRHRDHRARPGAGPPPGRGGGRRAGRPSADRPHLPQLPQSRARHARGGVPRARAERRVPARLSRSSPRWSSPLLEFLAGQPAGHPQRRLRHPLPQCRAGPRTAASRWPSAAPSTRCCWRSAASRARRNSLDALCRRFAVDNSARTRHGALLDCELLAEVYLHLIGGRQIGLGLERRGQRGAAAGGSQRMVRARRARTRLRRRSWRPTPRSSPSSTTRSGCTDAGAVRRVTALLRRACGARSRLAR